ncbi:hypothetical protein [Metallococcus carri]|nr:hypothetical protein [Metallococcus carri]
MAGSAQERVEKERLALELRRAGATFDEIAREVGYRNRSAAKKAFDRALANSGGPEVDRATARTHEVDRLDRLLLAVWPKAMKGELDSVREARQIVRLRTHLLGLAIAPSPMFVPQLGDDDVEEPTGTDGGEVIPQSRLEQRRRELDDIRRHAPKP